MRQRVAALSRHTWGRAQSAAELALRLESWRSYYCFLRYHQALRMELAQPIERGKCKCGSWSGLLSGQYLSDPTQPFLQCRARTSKVQAHKSCASFPEICPIVHSNPGLFE